VRGFRKHHDIAVYRNGEWAERGEITLDAAAQIIGVAKMTALRMIRRGDLKGRQACKGGRLRRSEAINRSGNIKSHAADL
jgi:predicted site-specific integrase-resolvase